ncbi:MAG TPA: ABC transporter permease [Flavisolibacter sp.]|nr:ABC transporter permease [Flavisolibacter sp.]
MRRMFEISLSSFKLAMQELWTNKLRTFLSLFGVTIGIFCIIGVLATVNSLETNIQTEIKSLGTNTIFIDKWDYSAGAGSGDYPWWKYVKRPSPRFEELQQIRQRASTVQHAAFVINTTGNVEVGDNLLNGVVLYGITEAFPSIQPVEIQYGRMMTDAEYSLGTNAVLIGNEIAEKLFGEAERATGRQLTIKGRRVNVAGVIKKQGSQLIGGWQFDKSVLMNYRYARTIMDEKRADPVILVKGRENMSSKVVKDELKGVMRSVHKLSPTQDDDFALNDINDFSDAMSQAFVSVNIGGWAIGALSFIVGIFGVANIMFVTVKERTGQIGLKKAIGARNSVILTEFLLESAFLCIIGGIIGLLLVFTLTKIITSALDFPIFLSPAIIGLAILICIIAGVLAGIIPAIRASRLDPVVAIRSK